MSRLLNFLRQFEGKRVAILGLARSNMPLIAPLAEVGAQLILCDACAEGWVDIEKWRAAGYELHLGEEYLDGWEADVVIRTPGIRPDAGRLKELTRRGTLLTSEMELFFDCCPCPITAITGSDGKTTTTSLIAAIFKAAGVTTWLGGNIGQPLLPMVDQMEREDRAVVEVSSFQLMTLWRAPDVAVVTNVSPNHLDWHKEYDEYRFAKQNIFRGQSARQWLVLNTGDAESLAWRTLAPGRVRTFGLQRAEVTVQDGWVVARGTQVLPLKEWRLPGQAFLEDLLAAVAAVWELVPIDAIRKAASEFNGVEHRLEWVLSSGGVAFYNDSIATSPSRAVAGLRAFDRKVILIAGGKDKGISFKPLLEALPEHVKAMVLTGNAAAVMIEKEAQGMENLPPITRVDTMREAVELAVSMAQEGDIVTLSPACTAFDAYRDFAARGEDYKRLVRDITANKLERSE